MASNIPWLASMQAGARSQLHQWGFPTRHSEEWKYTQVDSLLKQSFVTPSWQDLDEAIKDSESDVGDCFAYGSHKSALGEPLHQIFIHNGVISGINACLDRLPAGVLVMPLVEALVSKPELLKKHLGSVLQANTLFMR